MTLEEAIDKEDYKANLCCQLGDIERSNNNFAGIIEFVCKESYHRQIAEWLYELWTIKQKSEEKYWNNK